MKLSMKVLFVLSLLCVGAVGGYTGLLIGTSLAAEPNDIGGDPINFLFELGSPGLIFEQSAFSVAPASNNTALVVGTNRKVTKGTVLPSTFISGSGTDEFLVMWDGTSALQDVPKWKGSGGLLTYFGTGATGPALLLVDDGVTRMQVNNDGSIYSNDTSGTNSAELEYQSDGRWRVDGSAVGGGLYYAEAPANGTNKTGFLSPTALGADLLYELPDDTPSDGEQLTYTTGGDLEWQAAGGGGGMTDWDMDADTGTAETVSDGELAQWLSGTGMDSAVSATRTITYSLDFDEITEFAGIDPETDGIMYNNNSTPNNRAVMPRDLICRMPAEAMPFAADEFFNVPTTSVSAWTSPLGTLVISGGSIIGIGTTADHPGVAAIRTGTGTTGAAGLISNDTAIILGGGPWEFICICQNANASDATNVFVQRMGFNDSASTDGSDGCFFRYTHSVAGADWETVTQAGGVETATDTGVPFSTATWQRFEVKINAAATSVDFLLNGTVISTHTTNIPTAATGILVGSIIKSAGTSNRQIQVDHCAVYNSLTTRR